MIIGPHLIGGVNGGHGWTLWKRVNHGGMICNSNGNAKIAKKIKVKKQKDKKQHGCLAATTCEVNKTLRLIHLLSVFN